MFSAQLQPIERVEDLADRPVQLRDGVTARAHRGRADEARMRHARHVRIVRREVQEERLRAMLLENATALPVNVSAMSSSFHSAALPPVM